jgi:hypothetical protein
MKCLSTHSGSIEKAVNCEEINCLARLLQREGERERERERETGV